MKKYNIEYFSDHYQDKEAWYEEYAGLSTRKQARKYINIQKKKEKKMKIVNLTKYRIVVVETRIVR